METIRGSRADIEAFLGCNSSDGISFSYNSQYARLNDTHIVQAANLWLAKLERYYNMIKSIPAYIAAVVLDPSSKFEFFETCSWHGSEIENAQKMMIKLWETNYKSSGPAQTDEAASQAASQTASQTPSRESGHGDFVE